MKQTTKTLMTVGGLAAVALAVAFAAAWAGRDEERKTEAKEKSEKLFELDKSAARELVLSRNGKLIADFKRADDKTQWKIVAPVQTDADETAVNAMVDKLSTLKSKSQVEGMDPKQAGLADDAHARISATVTDAGGKSFGLLIGEENPFDQSLYAKKLGEPVLRLLAKAEQAPFQKELFDLRDKRVMHVDEASGFAKLEVTPDSAALHTGIGSTEGGTFAYEIDREGNDWKLAKPVAGPADNGAIDRLVAALKTLRAKGIASETSDDATLARYGLAFPKLAVSANVTSLGGKESFVRKLLIGQPPLVGGTVTIKTYAKRDDSPTIYEVDGQIVKDLSRDLFDLQDKTVLKIDREQVRRIEYTSPGHPAIEVTRTKGALPDGGPGEEKFAVTAPQPGPAKKFKISGNLYAFANLKAAAFGDPKPSNEKGLAKFGLDHPRTVTLFGDKDAVLGKVLIGSETGEKDKKRMWALVEGNPRVIELEKSTVDDLPLTAQDALEAPPAPAGATAALPPVSLPGMGKK